MSIEELDGRWMQFKEKLKQHLGEKHDEPMKETDHRPQQLLPQAWGSSPTEWMRFTRD